jgi:hypothetical protein
MLHFGESSLDLPSRLKNEQCELGVARTRSTKATIICNIFKF